MRDRIAPLISALRSSYLGLARAARTERAVRQELAALAVGTPVAFVVSERALERAALIGVLLFVLSIELLNTAVEKLCDHLAPGQHPSIGYVKDLGSGAVLMSLLLAALVWGSILLG